MQVTNLIIDNGIWKERWLLPPFREAHDRALELSQKDENDWGGPTVIVGEDELWWNDDLVFVIERMADIISNSVKEECKKIEAREWKQGDKEEVVIARKKLTITADTSPMDKCEYKFL